jgi:hypothetical protein
MYCRPVMFIVCQTTVLYYSPDYHYLVLQAGRCIEIQLCHVTAIVLVTEMYWPWNCSVHVIHLCDILHLCRFVLFYFVVYLQLYSTRDLIIRRGIDIILILWTPPRMFLSQTCMSNATLVSEWLLFNANSTIFQLYHGGNKLIFNEMMMMPALF